MNCLEFRRAILINPRDESTALQEHGIECTACASFKKDQVVFEQKLNDTMNVDIPDGLTAKILLAQSTGKVQTQKRQRRIYSIAAGLILAVGIVVGVQINSSFQPVDELVLAHVKNEAKHLKDRLNIKDAKIKAIFKNLNMTVNESLGTVNYAGNCDIRNNENGAHIVLQGKNGPVTVLIMPAEIISKRQSISDKRFHGVIIPAPRGSFAIIGGHSEILEPYIKQVGRVIQM